MRVGDTVYPYNVLFEKETKIWQGILEFQVRIRGVSRHAIQKSRRLKRGVDRSHIVAARYE